MLKHFIFYACLLFISQLFAQEDIYLKNETYTYDETIEIYKKFAKDFPKKTRYTEMGSSDFGLPMSLFLMSEKGDFSTETLHSQRVILINNGIHPGEPCGVDACIKLCREMLNGEIPKNVIIAIIPIYNIGGAHNRNCCSRANQNGPIEYGFRGNAKNLDLNRDFIKTDSENTKAFRAIFHYLKPTLFVDTHTSNGADYQHSMTLITSQLDKMNPALAEYTQNTLNPFLYKSMQEAQFPMVPYMHTYKETPDDGIIDFLETPRYSTGYTNLFNTISYVTEAHMLKPYPVRVDATYHFLALLIEFASMYGDELKSVRNIAQQDLLKKEYLHLNWMLDTTVFDTIPFKGYAAIYKPSAVTGNQRLYYDHAQPYEKHIRYYNHYIPTDSAKIPTYYILPKAWSYFILDLSNNQFPYYSLAADQILTVESYEILDYATTSSPYEGHYLHSNIRTRTVTHERHFRKGDIVIPVRNDALRFIMETLEPRAVDSYFAWNYFDAILQQKEWFSAYVFEDEAAEMLRNDSQLRADFERMKANDSTFAASDFAQLYYLYKQSPNYETTHNLYPVAKTHESLDELLLLR